ncbi:hypothetical protein ACSFBX_11185 [Variovorax sp. RB2P76]|uniref:hypothetical protein n=1 Tax=Variovorax sp. RB2P76 TaxID=3443736 RepID=UPI003F44EFB7
MSFPTSQSELIQAARGHLTKTEFAKTLGVDRTCLSRYESEKLGAPTKVLNFCLRAIAARHGTALPPEADVEQALAHARQAVAILEHVSAEGAVSPVGSIEGKRI